MMMTSSSPNVEHFVGTLAAPEPKRFVAWAETWMAADRVWPLVASVVRWSEWLPGVSWTSALAPSPPHADPHRVFHAMWQGRLFEGHFRELHPLSYLEVELSDPRLGFAFDCCVALSRLPLGHTVIIAEMVVAPWLLEDLAGKNPADEFVAALRLAAQAR